MHEPSDRSSASGRSPERGRNDRGPPTSAVLIVLLLIALACIGGYALLMKLINVSREDDCLLAHRRDCGAIEVPNGR